MAEGPDNAKSRRYSFNKKKPQVAKQRLKRRKESEVEQAKERKKVPLNDRRQALTSHSTLPSLSKKQQEKRAHTTG
jgi:hypothetical protein